MTRRYRAFHRAAIKMVAGALEDKQPTQNKPYGPHCNKTGPSDITFSGHRCLQCRDAIQQAMGRLVFGHDVHGFGHPVGIKEGHPVRIASAP
jgi:hypothetical protein